MSEATQGTLSLIVGAYYAGLYGLAAPELSLVSYALLGLLVLFHLRMKTSSPAAHLYVSGALLLLWGSWAGLSFGMSPKKRQLSDVLASCDTEICEQLENALTSMGGHDAYWAEAPHTKEQRQGVTVLAVVMTAILCSYFFTAKSIPNTTPAAVGTPWLVAVALAVWVGWVTWAMQMLSSYVLVQQAKRDMIYPQMDGGAGLAHVTPMVTRMQLYAMTGFVVVAAAALSPQHPALPLLCFLYLFMGMYFLSNVYRINRMIVTLEMGPQKQGQLPPAVPTYACGISMLGGSTALALLALYWQNPKWICVLLVLVVLGFAAWDTHAVERVQDALV